jgi:hypothetical protein
MTVPGMTVLGVTVMGVTVLGVTVMGVTGRADLPSPGEYRAGDLRA